MKTWADVMASVKFSSLLNRDNLEPVLMTLESMVSGTAKFINLLEKKCIFLIQKFFVLAFFTIIEFHH